MNKRLTKSNLQSVTNDFFKLHWNDKDLGQPPSWDGVWNFKGTVPNHDTPGCYALLAGDEVIYIGVGARKGSGHYEEHGLGARISSYWRKLAPGSKTKEAQDCIYQPVKKWQERGVDTILTLGLPRGRGYLAYSLEAYLIARLSPIRYNTAKPGASGKLNSNSA